MLVVVDGGGGEKDRVVIPLFPPLAANPGSIYAFQISKNGTIDFYANFNFNLLKDQLFY